MQINSVILIRKIRSTFNIELKNTKKTTIIFLKVCFCSHIWRKMRTNSLKCQQKLEDSSPCKIKEKAGLTARLFRKERRKKSEKYFKNTLLGSEEMEFQFLSFILVTSPNKPNFCWSRLHCFFPGAVHTVIPLPLCETTYLSLCSSANHRIA